MFLVAARQEWDVYVNASNSDAGRIIQFMRWYGRYPLELTYDFITQNFNPYFYGYPWEVGSVAGTHASPFHSKNAFQQLFWDS